MERRPEAAGREEERGGRKCGDEEEQRWWRVDASGWEEESTDVPRMR